MLEAFVRRRCGELGVDEVITPLVLEELRRRALDEAKRVSTHRPGGTGHRTKKAAIKQTQTADRFASSQRQHARAASKRLDREVSSLQTHLTSLIKQYQAGDLSYRRLKARASIAFKGTVEQAFKLGTKAVGLVTPTGALYDLTVKEKEWIKSYVKEEMKYFERFLDDVRKQISQKQIDRRVGLYSSAVRSVYESGRVLSVGNDVLIYWTLESDDPCKDCIELSRHNPYTPKVLPTTPKAGATRCLSNCYCTLRIDKSDPKKVAQVEKKHPGSAWILRKIKNSRKKKKN